VPHRERHSFSWLPANRRAVADDPSAGLTRSVSSLDVAHWRSWNADAERRAGRGHAVGRREFIRLAVAAGVALPGASAVLAACDRERPDIGERSDDAGRPDVKVLAATPPMGWNSWNVYGENIDESKILAIADAIVQSGMRDAGWEYVMLDDGWQKTRGSRFLYELDYDPRKFPRGIKFLADHVHEKGMKLGIYSGPGVETCAGYTGSSGHEAEDAQLFASWGVDHLKYDSCCWPGKGADGLFEMHEKMSDALKATGRDILLHVCHCGWDDVWEWAREAGGHHWRIGQDITDDFDVPGHREGYYFDVLDMIDRGVGLEQYSGPGGWNDYDMLVVNLKGEGALVGDGATPEEYRTHFSMWAILSSPLIIGSDLTEMDAYTAQTLTNGEVIALNQDPLGIQAALVRKDGDLEVFAKPLANGDWGVALLNRGLEDAEIGAGWQEDLGVDWSAATVRDLWMHRDLGSHREGFATTVGSHEATILRVTPENENA
jgi:alpha-galactosidase